MKQRLCAVAALLVLALIVPQASAFAVAPEDLPLIEARGVAFPGTVIHYGADNVRLRTIVFDEEGNIISFVTHVPPERETELPARVNVYDGARRRVATNYNNVDTGELVSYNLYNYDDQGNLSSKNGRETYTRNSITAIPDFIRTQVAGYITIAGVNKVSAVQNFVVVPDPSIMPYGVRIELADRTAYDYDPFGNLSGYGKDVYDPATGQPVKAISYHYIYINGIRKVEASSVAELAGGIQQKYTASAYEYYTSGAIMTKDITYTDTLAPEKSYHRLYHYREDGTLERLDRLDGNVLISYTLYNPDPASLGLPLMEGRGVVFPGKVIGYGADNVRLRTTIFDEAGNIVSVIVHEPSRETEIPAYAITYDDANHRIARNNYDGAGNLISYVLYNPDPAAIGIPPLEGRGVTPPCTVKHYTDDGQLIRTLVLAADNSITRLTVHAIPLEREIPSYANAYNADKKIIARNTYDSAGALTSYVLYAYGDDGYLAHKDGKVTYGGVDSLGRPCFLPIQIVGYLTFDGVTKAREIENYEVYADASTTPPQPRTRLSNKTVHEFDNGGDVQRTTREVYSYDAVSLLKRKVVVYTDYLTPANSYRAVYTYYANAANRVASLALDEPDGRGLVYYHYLDEYRVGEEHGRADRFIDVTGNTYAVTYYGDSDTIESVIMTSADSLSTTYLHFMNETIAGSPYGRIDVYTNEDGITHEFTYYGGEMQIESIAYAPQSTDGVVYRHYRNEDRPDRFLGNILGRVDVVRLAVPNALGEIEFHTDYVGDSDLERTVRAYAADGTLLHTYRYDATGALIEDNSPAAALLRREAITEAEFNNISGHYPPYMQGSYLQTMSYDEFMNEPISAEQVAYLDQLLQLGMDTDTGRFSALLDSVGNVILMPYTPIDIPTWLFDAAGVVWDDNLVFYCNYGTAPTLEDLRRVLPLFVREIAHMYDVEHGISDPQYGNAGAEQYQNQEMVNWMRLLGYDNALINREQWMTDRIADRGYTGLAAQYITGWITDIDPVTGYPYDFVDAYAAIMAPLEATTGYLSDRYGVPVDQVRYLDSALAQIDLGGIMQEGYDMHVSIGGVDHQVFVTMDGRAIFHDGSWTWTVDAPALLDRTRVSEEEYDALLENFCAPLLVDPATGQPLSYDAFVSDQSAMAYEAAVYEAICRGLEKDAARFSALLANLQHLIFVPQQGSAGAGHLAGGYSVAAGAVLTSFDPTSVPDPEMCAYILLGIIAHESKEIADDIAGFHTIDTVAETARGLESVMREDLYFTGDYWRETMPAYHNRMRFMIDHIADNGYTGPMAQYVSLQNTEYDAMSPYEAAEQYICSRYGVDQNAITYETSALTGMDNGGVVVEGYSITFSAEGEGYTIFSDMTGTMLFHDDAWISAVLQSSEPSVVDPDLAGMMTVEEDLADAHSSLPEGVTIAPPQEPEAASDYIPNP